MYSHYMSGSFAPLVQEHAHRNSARSSVHAEKKADNGLSGVLKGLLSQFSLQSFDTGDILLVLIILFLLLEGDNLEMVITLGFLLLLGLKDGGQDGS